MHNISRRGNSSWVHQAVLVNGQPVPACKPEPVARIAGWQAVEFAVNCTECIEVEAEEGYYDAANEPLVVWRGL